MSKKRKTPATSTKSARKTEAPMLVTRAKDATPTTEPAVAPAVVAAPPAPVTKVAIEAPMAEAPQAEAELDRGQVARLAFAKFVARGCAHGHHVEDWFAAEAELRAARRN